MWSEWKLYFKLLIIEASICIFHVKMACNLAQQKIHIYTKLRTSFFSKLITDCLLVVLGLAALWDSISVYIGPSPREREKEERKDREE